MSWEKTQTRSVAAEFQKGWGINHLLCSFCNRLSLKTTSQGFPGGSVIENPPANAGDTSQSLIWEDPTCLRATKPMCCNYWACDLEPRAPQLLKPVYLRACALQPEKPLKWEAHTPQLESRPTHCNWRKPTQWWRTSTAKNKWEINKNFFKKPHHIELLRCLKQTDMDINTYFDNFKTYLSEISKYSQMLENIRLIFFFIELDFFSDLKLDAKSLK